MLSQQFVEAASWHLASELLRRNPAMTLIQTHPGGGQYDCLSLYGPSSPSGAAGELLLNRVGRLALFRRFDGAPLPTEREVTAELQLDPADDTEQLDVGPNMVQFDIWSLMATTNLTRELVDRVARIAGIPTPEPLPPSTPAVIAFRLAARLMSSTLFRRRARFVTNGYFDSSGATGSRLKSELFDRFPEARREVELHQSGDFLDNPGYRYWFVLGQAPALCISTDGRLWTSDGGQMDLNERYQVEGRDLDRLTVVVLRLWSGM